MHEAVLRLCERVASEVVKWLKVWRMFPPGEEHASRAMQVLFLDKTLPATERVEAFRNHVRPYTGTHKASIQNALKLEQDVNGGTSFFYSAQL